MTLVGPLPLYLMIVVLVFIAGFCLGAVGYRLYVINVLASLAYPGGDGSRPQVVKLNRIARAWRRWRGWRKAERRQGG